MVETKDYVFEKTGILICPLHQQRLFYVKLISGAVGFRCIDCDNDCDAYPEDLKNNAHN